MRLKMEGCSRNSTDPSEVRAGIKAESLFSPFHLDLCVCVCSYLHQYFDVMWQKTITFKIFVYILKYSSYIVTIHIIFTCMRYT